MRAGRAPRLHQRGGKGNRGVYNKWTGHNPKPGEGDHVTCNHIPALSVPRTPDTTKRQILGIRRPLQKLKGSVNRARGYSQGTTRAHQETPTVRAETSSSRRGGLQASAGHGAGWRPPPPPLTHKPLPHDTAALTSNQVPHSPPCHRGGTPCSDPGRPLGATFLVRSQLPQVPKMLDNEDVVSTSDRGHRVTGSPRLTQCPRWVERLEGTQRFPATLSQMWRPRF